MSYTVFVCDMFHFADDPEHELEIPGFPTQEVAIEYARRRLRSSLEELRKEEQSPEELRDLWYTFGEDCRVVGPEGVVYLASAHLDYFIRHPATPEECDYQSLYESLLPADFSLECLWEAATVPPPHHYEYRITVHPYDPPSANTQADGTQHPRIQGEITFWPDYRGLGTPEWKERFFVSTQACLRVYTLLQEGGLLQQLLPQSEEDRIIGGETATLEVRAGGRIRPINSSQLPRQQRIFLLDTVMQAIRAMVPDEIWKTLSARRQAYHQAGEADPPSP